MWTTIVPQCMCVILRPYNFALFWHVWLWLMALPLATTEWPTDLGNHCLTFWPCYWSAQSAAYDPWPVAWHVYVDFCHVMRALSSLQINCAVFLPSPRYICNIMYKYLVSHFVKGKIERHWLTEMYNWQPSHKSLNMTENAAFWYTTLTKHTFRAGSKV